MAAARLGKFDDIRVISPGVVREAAAYSVMVELPPGTPARNAVNKQAELASAAGVDVPQVAVDPVHGHAGRFLLWVADSDLLVGPPIPSPLVTRLTAFNVWADKVPVGGDVRGRSLSFGLPERSLLVGGEPGGGKSVSCNNVLGTVSMDPWARLWTIDGKGGADLSDYEPIEERFLGEPDCEAALALLRDAQDEMSDRYRRLKAIGARKVNAELSVELDMRLLVIHLDEIQVFATDETHGKAIVKALWDLVSRGRASGCRRPPSDPRPSCRSSPGARTGCARTPAPCRSWMRARPCGCSRRCSPRSVTPSGCTPPTCSPS
ncbi:FtsK/SpoIIIE domain-containing protein [Streptosporangium subroseum]|uniref:FtsK/SpoIIIE domain-containing protein n=1 Tax=Streptosporangium subroseum TaxID=106412 RepID=UPI00341B51A0